MVLLLLGFWVLGFENVYIFGPFLFHFPLFSLFHQNHLTKISSSHLFFSGIYSLERLPIISPITFPKKRIREAAVQPGKKFCMTS
ncbi:hypothetical protein H5410_058751 [Solanum commersonii]|uniref:Uncharacterized protein n=1 Tax=Solanum commersonii TaxID=4109 RepID=A0A9J5WS12_SOLCO|nr:hypothetical protein H5410_058751 [Solanum commersonii]